MEAKLVLCPALVMLIPVHIGTGSPESLLANIALGPLCLLHGHVFVIQEKFGR